MGDSAALNQLMTELPAFESETHSAHQHFMRVADYLDAYVDQPPQVSEVAKLLRFVGRRQALPPYYGFALIIELLAVLAAQLPWLVMHGCISVVQLLKLTKPQPWYFSLPQLTISGRVFAEVSTRTTVDVIQWAAEIATYCASLFDARLSPTATGFRDAVSRQLDQQPPQPPSVDTVFPAPDSVPVTTTDDYFYQLKLSIYDIEREVTQRPTTERHLRLIELYDDLGWQSVAGCAVLELARTTTNPIEQFSLMERAYGYFDNAERLQPVDLSAELVRLGREIATTGECRYLACALLTHASALTYYTDTEMPAIMAVIDEAATVATTIDDGSFPPERFLQLKASVALACDDPESAFQFYEHAIAELVAKDQWDDAVELALRVATLCDIDERKTIALLADLRDNPALPDMRLYGRLAGATHDIIAGYDDA
ncbi:hypothetical protein CMUST_06580 [Corynebacterium mustelae]|uniref:Uncharacterized protein n=2 Tax=Corynebacterium mustelae TaxID=571915 RepID=A0A0G3GWY7_9CORY|nr:hypothetical protein CMUST_06580 [Corynebacterium mustelae]